MRRKDIFVFAYYSYKDPVFVSATLNYLLKIAERSDDFRFHLLTFEHAKFQYESGQKEQIEAFLKKNEIIWYRSKWRTGKLFKPFVKLWDLVTGIALGIKIVKRNKCQLIYSEGVVGASISFFVSRFCRVPQIVHSFEPHADSMLDAGVWKKASWEYRILQFFERKVISKSKGLITGTNAYKKEIISWGVDGSNVHVIPSCIDTRVYRFSRPERIRIRKELGADDSDIVITYLGKFGGMYMKEELFRFFANCEHNSTLSFKYWIFTTEEKSSVELMFDKHTIPSSKLIVKKLIKEEVYGHLSAADVGVVAVRPLKSKRYCSPIKTGEYWACGLPVLVPKGVGDDYVLVRENLKLGRVIEDLETYNLQEPIERIADKSAKEIRSLDYYIQDLEDILRN